jgi:hypothetical protein
MHCGGKSENKNPSELGDKGKLADAFVREKVPEVAHAPLIHFRSQVVAGSIYYFTYEGYVGDIQVWLAPGSKGNMEVTLPNGVKFANH